MSKDPAFLFYPNDWMGGTMLFSLEEKGAYMELLILQFNRGAFTRDQAIKVLRSAELWDCVSSKFDHDDTGHFFNSRLAVEISKRKNFCESRRTNRLKKTTDSSHDSHVSNHMSEHMGNANENESKKDNKAPKSELNIDLVPPYLKQQIDVWLAYKRQRGESYKQKGFDSLINRLMRLNITPDQLGECVDFSMSNNWAGLFPEKLKPNGESKSNNRTSKFVDAAAIATDVAGPGR